MIAVPLVAARRGGAGGGRRLDPRADVRSPCSRTGPLPGEGPLPHFDFWPAPDRARLAAAPRVRATSNSRATTFRALCWGPITRCPSCAQPSGYCSAARADPTEPRRVVPSAPRTRPPRAARRLGEILLSTDPVVVGIKPWRSGRAHRRAHSTIRTAKARSSPPTSMPYGDGPCLGCRASGAGPRCRRFASRF